MFSINIQVTPGKAFEQPRGFKGINVQTSDKQVIEMALGFKGLGIVLPTSLTGSATKIIHYR